MKIETIAREGYEHIARCEDPESGLRALISIHDTTLGPALGGMRMWPYASWDDALFDVLRLSKGMTYKSAVADTGLGGGKSVILGNPKTDKSAKLFEAMGSFVDSMGGRYITAEDVGTSVEDMVILKRKTKWVTGLPHEMGSSGDPSPWTALGVFRGMKACLEEVFGSGDFKGKTVAIQGCGHVGMYLARHLHEAGAKLFLADISEDRAKSLADETGGQVMDPSEILFAECDIMAPCALGAVLNDDTLPKLRTPIIAGAANNVLLREEHGLKLKEAGILYAPDYVINAGGIINVSIEVEPSGYDEARARAKVENIYIALKRVFEIAKEQGISTNEASNRLAEERLRAASAKA
ncbi:MAG: Glu/Leu/Phe/Val dehydrogenase dimerization domain-containing protein [Planctomycetota bacterium]|nr:Glu/Leu/Phe/Val dehydrogenase [Planctomycetota bacterium]MCB9899903.1 Glu/Leu/Phe/Val dehydrogenase [Planctomycetota bacterium]